MIEPTPNDVLSGRGASFNRHPGNENFRRMLEQHREVYSQSVKVRKVAITKSIVEAIYSMEPPGRFLRKCATTGEWEELSKKEADNKAAQAMAYAVRGLTKGGGPSRGVPSQIHLLRNDQESEPATDRETTDNSTSPSLQLQRLLPSLQQSRSVNILPDQNPTNNTAQAAASLNGLAQSLNRGQQQLILQQQQQQQQSLLSLLGQRSLQPQTQHVSASVPLNPSLSAHLQRALLDDILRHQLLSSLTQQQQQQQSLLSLLGQRSLQPQTQHASASVPLNPLSTHLQRALVDNFLLQSLQTAQLPDMQSITNRQQDLLSLTTREIPQNQTEMSPRQQPSVNQLQHRLDALLQDQLLLSLQQNQWLLQYPSRPLDLLRQALQGSQNDANLHPRLSRTSTSSPPTRQQGGLEDEEKQDERE